VIPLIKFYTEQMFVSVDMQFRNHCRHKTSEAFQVTKGQCLIYTILNLECCKCARMRFHFVKVWRWCAVGHLTGNIAYIYCLLNLYTIALFGWKSNKLPHRKRVPTRKYKKWQSLHWRKTSKIPLLQKYFDRGMST